MTMPAPTKKSWVKGALYLATDDTAAASPLLAPVEFTHDPGLNEEAVPHAGATTTPNIMLLATPSIQFQYTRRSDEDRVLKAGRHCRDNLTGVRWYLYIDTTNEAAVYAYGMGFVKPSLSGGATAAVKGQATIIPDPTGTWNDAALIG